MKATIRRAQADDAATILRMIRRIAEYEKEKDAVEATEESLREQLLTDPAPFECLLAESGGQAVGFALYFHNYSTWRGRRGLYLEDLFVSPKSRGLGIGGALLAQLAAIAVERGCARMEWSVLNWNTPAIRFYEALGAKTLSGWTTWRLTDDALERLASSSR